MFLKSNALPRLDLSNILLSWKEKELHWKHNSNLNPYQQCFTVMFQTFFGDTFFQGVWGEVVWAVMPPYGSWAKLL